jgi:hypothetical protein
MALIPIPEGDCALTCITTLDSLYVDTRSSDEIAAG